MCSCVQECINPFLLKQGLVYPRLASKLSIQWRWLWASDLPTSTTTPNCWECSALPGVENQTQGLGHARQTVFHFSYIPALDPITQQASKFSISAGPSAGIRCSSGHMSIHMTVSHFKRSDSISLWYPFLLPSFRKRSLCHTLHSLRLISSLPQVLRALNKHTAWAIAPGVTFVPKVGGEAGGSTGREQGGMSIAAGSVVFHSVLFD